MIRLASATVAPEVRKRYGVKLGLVAAVLMLAFALIHLFRIDTFVPEMGYALPFGNSWASLIALLLLTAEVFALPVLLRMKLSAMARFAGGLLVVMVPLAWLLIAIWNLGLPISTVQLGEFYNLPSSWLLVGFNTLWLALNYWALWALGFDTPKRLSK